MESIRKICLISIILTLSGEILNAQEHANDVIAKALILAKKENKNVFVKFTAFWCGWCKVLDQRMKSESCKKYFNDNYVIVTLTANEDNIRKMIAKDKGEAFVSNENPGANELLAIYGSNKADKSIKKFGIPFWYILDAHGNLLEDAFDEKGENMGCPSKDETVEKFITKVQSTSSLTSENVEAIKKTFITKK